VAAMLEGGLTIQPDADAVAIRDADILATAPPAWPTTGLVGLSARWINAWEQRTKGGLECQGNVAWADCSLSQRAQ